MEVIRPAMLLRKLGLPQETICRIIPRENRGPQKWSRAFPRKKGIKASRAQRIIPRQVAVAAPQTPQPKTPRKRNSSTALETDMRMFTTMLPRM